MNFQEKTADLLYKAVKRSAVAPSSIEIGDLVVVTGADTDTIGVVNSFKSKKSSTTITLKTFSGIETLDVSDNNFLHVIQKVAMLDLRKHNQYQRENEESNQEVDRITENKDEHKERPEFSAEKSEKSKLPTSKISLSLRNKK